MKLTTLSLLLCLVPLSLVAQTGTYPGNTWFDSLGTFQNKALLENQTTIVNPEYSDRVFHVLSDEGYIKEYITIEDEIGLSTIIFGTEKGLLDFKPGSNLSFNSFKGQLPFGLTFGMSQKELENKAGVSIDDHLGGVQFSYLKAVKYGTKMYEFLHLPQLGNVNMYLQFIEDKLEIVLIEYDTGPGSFKGNYLTDKMTYSLSETVGERVQMDKAFKPIFITSLLDYLLRSDSPQSFYNFTIRYPAIVGPEERRADDENNITLSWCVDNVQNPDILFSSTIDYLSLSLDPRYRFGLYPDFVKSDYRSEKVSDNERLFFHTNDRYNYKSYNDSLLFHAYYLPENKEIIVNTYFPSKSGENPKRRTFEKNSYRNCADDKESKNQQHSSPDLATIDENTIEELKNKFDDFPGNHWLAIIGSLESEAVPRANRLYYFYEEGGSSRHIKTLEFSFVSRKDHFKEKAPFGLKRNLKLKDAGKAFSELTAAMEDEGDGFKNYEYEVPVIGEVKLHVKLYFNDKERLYHAGISINQPRSEEWLSIRDKIFPVSDQ